MRTLTSVPPDVSLPGQSTIPIQTLQDFRARTLDGNEMNVPQLLRQLLHHSQIVSSLSAIHPPFNARVVWVQDRPTRILPPNRFRRGVVLTNMVSNAGLPLQTLWFAPGILPPGVYISNRIPVDSLSSLRIFLELGPDTGGSVRIDVQSRMPNTSNFTTVQQDIFANNSPGIHYTMVGPLGIDLDVRLVMTITGAARSVLVSSATKDGMPGLGGNAYTIFIGGQDMRLDNGFPLRPGDRERFYLAENIELWAMSPVSNTPLNVVEVQ